MKARDIILGVMILVTLTTYNYAETNETTESVEEGVCTQYTEETTETTTTTALKETTTTTTTIQEPTTKNTTTTTTKQTKQTTSTTTKNTTTTTTKQTEKKPKSCRTYCRLKGFEDGQCRLNGMECRIHREIKSTYPARLCYGQRYNTCCCITEESIE